jgi:hypothetical protein
VVSTLYNTSIPLVCFRSIPPIHFLRSIPLVSFPLHFPPCLWILFSHPPRPLPNFLLFFLLSFSYYSPIEVPSQGYTIFPVFFHCVFDTSSCCFQLFTLLYIVNIFLHLLLICTFVSMHPSSSRFSCLFL